MVARRLILSLGFTLLASAAQAQTAAQPTLLGEFNDWQAFTYQAQGSKVCFAHSQPTRTEPSGVNRDPIHIFVTHRPGEGVRNEVSVITGYPYREGSTATVTVGTDSYSLFTKNDGAWVQDASDESSLLGSMRRGRDMIVKGTSQRGTLTTDTYSLMGVSAALDRIEQECE